MERKLLFGHDFKPTLFNYSALNYAIQFEIFKLDIKTACEYYI